MTELYNNKKPKESKRVAANLLPQSWKRQIRVYSIILQAFTKKSPGTTKDYITCPKVKILSVLHPLPYKKKGMKNYHLIPLLSPSFIGNKRQMVSKSQEDMCWQMELS